MTYPAALKQCRKVGTNHATGDALRAMFANLITLTHGGDVLKYFAHLSAFGSDSEITERSRALLRDRQAAWDVLIA